MNQDSEYKEIYLGLLSALSSDDEGELSQAASLRILTENCLPCPRLEDRFFEPTGPNSDILPRLVHGFATACEERRLDKSLRLIEVRPTFQGESVFKTGQLIRALQAGGFEIDRYIAFDPYSTSEATRAALSDGFDLDQEIIPESFEGHRLDGFQTSLICGWDEAFWGQTKLRSYFEAVHIDNTISQLSRVCQNSFWLTSFRTPKAIPEEQAHIDAGTGNEITQKVIDHIQDTLKEDTNLADINFAAKTTIHTDKLLGSDITRLRLNLAPTDQAICDIVPAKFPVSPSDTISLRNFWRLSALELGKRIINSGSAPLFSGTDEEEKAGLFLARLNWT